MACGGQRPDSECSEVSAFWPTLQFSVHRRCRAHIDHRALVGLRSPLVSGATMATSFRRVAVYVIEARKLAAMDLSGSSDPYCKLKLGPMTLETEVIPNTTSPHWHEALFFSLPVIEAGSGGMVNRDDLLLSIDVFDSDAYKWDDPLGSAVVDVAALLSLAPRVPAVPASDGKPETVRLEYDVLREMWVRLDDGADGMVHLAVYLPPQDIALANSQEPATDDHLKLLGQHLSAATMQPAPPVCAVVLCWDP